MANFCVKRKRRFSYRQRKRQNARGRKMRIAKAIGRNSRQVGFRNDVLHQVKTVLYQSQVVTGTYTGEVTATLSTIPEYSAYETLYGVFMILRIDIIG